VRLYSKSISRGEVINFSEHGGLTLRADDEMRLGCHLIVSSLSRFVNTTVTAICGTESTASWNSGIDLNMHR
jgi:hypothetical protein